MLSSVHFIYNPFQSCVKYFLQLPIVVSSLVSGFSHKSCLYKNQAIIHFKRKQNVSVLIWCIDVKLLDFTQKSEKVGRVEIKSQLNEKLETKQKNEIGLYLKTKCKNRLLNLF